MSGTPPLAWGGTGCLTALAPDEEVQAVQDHPRASVGVLFRPHGMEGPQAGLTCAGGVQQADQGVAPPGVVGGPLFTTAVMDVLIGALVEAPAHRHRSRVVGVRKGVVRPVVPVPWRRVRQH